LIFSLGSGLSAYEGIHNLRHPGTLGSPYVNYMVLALAMIFEGITWNIARREFAKTKGNLGYFEAVRRGKNPSLFVVFFEDSAAILGIFAAFAGVLLSHITGNSFFDSSASIVISLILGGTAIWLAYETKSLLIGESANKETVKSIRLLAESVPEIESVKEVLTLHMGPDYILANLAVDFTDKIPAGEVERILMELDRSIKENHPEVKRIFIEPESV